MRQTRRRLLIIACLCACIGLGATVVWFFFFAHLTLRVATGPVGSEGQKFLAAFVRSVADAHPRVRLQIAPMTDRDASAKALTTGAADLAVVRSDDLTSTTGQTIAILRRDVVGLVIPSHAAIEKVGDLAGKTLGLLQGPVGDERIRHSRRYRTQRGGAGITESDERRHDAQNCPEKSDERRRRGSRRRQTTRVHA